MATQSCVNRGYSEWAKHAAGAPVVRGQAGGCAHCEALDPVTEGDLEAQVSELDDHCGEHNDVEC